jgi:protein TonB
MRKDCGTLSLAIHVVVILILALWTVGKTPQLTPQGVELVSVSPFRLRHLIYEGRPQGGGGELAERPATRGQLPRIAPRVFVPPRLITDDQPHKLMMEPTLVSIQRTVEIQAPNYGDPMAALGPPSPGRGNHGGIGDGENGGIGNKKGPSYGDGPGGLGGGQRAGGPYTPPQLVFRVEPEFSDEARKARLEGTVVIHAEIDVNGRASNIRVVRPLGLGLDERALDAVTRWRFRPATRGGKSCSAEAVIEVNFRLL